MYLTNVDPAQKVWVDKTEEKGSDVNLASHLLRDAYTGKFEVAVLITNDSDLAEPVRIVAQELNLPVGILNPPPVPQQGTEAVRHILEEYSARRLGRESIPANSDRPQRDIREADRMVIRPRNMAPDSRLS